MGDAPRGEAIGGSTDVAVGAGAEPIAFGSGTAGGGSVDAVCTWGDGGAGGFVDRTTTKATSAITTTAPAMMRGFLLMASF